VDHHHFGYNRQLPKTKQQKQKTLGHTVTPFWCRLLHAIKHGKQLQIESTDAGKTAWVTSYNRAGQFFFS
jgi:uncharacterized protein YjhX (UPF0386 family)